MRDVNTPDDLARVKDRAQALDKEMFAIQAKYQGMRCEGGR